MSAVLLTSPSPRGSPRGRYRTVRSCIVAFFVLAICLTVGCEESVDPIIGSDQPFTIWGFMNSGADTQYVRVYPISAEFVSSSTSPIDARVFSTDHSTGERREWSYRLVDFDSLGAGHVFWSPFRAEFGRRYRLDVVRSDDATTSAEIAVPPAVDIQVDASAHDLVTTLRIEGDVPNLVGPKVTYHGINVPPSNAWPPGTPVHPPVLHSVTVPYDHALFPTANGWRLTVNMIPDTAGVRGDFRANCLITSPKYSAPNVWLRSVEFTAVAADSSWRPPGGVFDPDVIAVPGTMSNVENGFGFFGAGHGIRVGWVPSVDARETAGYRFDGRCGMGPFDADECRNPPVPCVGENPQDHWEIWLRDVTAGSAGSPPP